MSAKTLLLRNDPHVDWEESPLEFRLTYEGPLLSDTERDGAVRRARAGHKHAIRKVFHDQLKHWWSVSPYLKPRDGSYEPGNRRFGRPGPNQAIDVVAEKFARFGYKFVPLVTRELELFCNVEILYLRLGDPGNLFMPNRVGDLDNRLKTLFDALTMPRDAGQVGEYTTPDADETPFFCLLEDDSVITRATVESDVLLQPVSTPPDPNDARVVIHVRIRPARLNSENAGFA